MANKFINFLKENWKGGILGAGGVWLISFMAPYIIIATLQPLIVYCVQLGLSSPWPAIIPLVVYFVVGYLIGAFIQSKLRK